jgi:hypothetical protein
VGLYTPSAVQLLATENRFQHLLNQVNHPVVKSKAPSSVQRQPTSKGVHINVDIHNCKD